MRGREGGREGGRERGGVKEDPNNINTHLSISTICIFTGSITNTHTHTDRWSVRERKGEREEGRRGKEGGGTEGKREEGRRGREVGWREGEKEEGGREGEGRRGGKKERRKEG